MAKPEDATLIPLSSGSMVVPACPTRHSFGQRSQAHFCAALAFLAGQFVDPNRVATVGFSQILATSFISP
jgi:hypothetical protein